MIVIARVGEQKKLMRDLLFLCMNMTVMTIRQTSGHLK